jgi:hypothetical protein
MGFRRFCWAFAVEALAILAQKCPLICWSRRKAAGQIGGQVHRVRQSENPR